MINKNEDLKNEVKFRIAMLKIDEEEKNSMKKSINKKTIVAACAILALSTGGVFAKDIENYFRSLFNNSSKAIDVAVENGYIQKEEMDYSYDEDIGIKVDNLVLDDLNLDISFNFEIKEENVKSIRLNNFIITNDNEKIVYQSEFKTAETLEELPLYNSVNWINEPVKLTDTTFTDSILFGLRPEKEDFKELHFDIKSVDMVYTDDKREVIDGTWKFNVTINDEMRQNENVIYTLAESNEYIESCTATMSNTGTIIELTSKVKIPTDRFIQDTISLSSNSATYEGGYIDFNEERMKMHFENVSNFIENDDILNLHLGFFDTTVVLTKEST